VKKYVLGGFIAGILFSSVIYAADEEIKVADVSCDDIKIEIRSFDRGNEEGSTVVIGRIMVRINGEWFPFRNQVYLESESGPDPVYSWEVKD